nr:MAG: replication initiator protein [Microviridae sp.]
MCLKPVNLKDANGLQVSVPCGKCPACIKRRASQWSYRLMQQEKNCDSAHFITLTYDNSHVPITPKGFMDLCRKDLQNFFKRLRKAHIPTYKAINGKIHLIPKQQIKYYAVGEYGGKSFRPHYHVILFNADIELIQDAWSYQAPAVKNRKPGKKPIKPCTHNHGKTPGHMGQVHYGKVEAASVGYCLKYMSKTKKIPLHKNDDRTPEFAIMSKGLGKEYLTPNMCRWHLSDKFERMYVNLLDGKKIAMPKYYKDRLYHDYERRMIGEYQRNKMIQKEYAEAAKNATYARDKKESADAAFRRLDWETKKTSII